MHATRVLIVDADDVDGAFEAAEFVLNDLDAYYDYIGLVSPDGEAIEASDTDWGWTSCSKNTMSKVCPDARTYDDWLRCAEGLAWHEATWFLDDTPKPGSREELLARLAEAIVEGDVLAARQAVLVTDTDWPFLHAVYDIEWQAIYCEVDPRKERAWMVFVDI